jgi:PhzF family phenazine biosynthesis protein
VGENLCRAAMTNAAYTSAGPPRPFAGHPTLGSARAWLDNGGVPHQAGRIGAVAQLPTAAEVLAVQPDLSVIPTAMVGAIGAYPDGSEHAFEMRTFAPGVGVAEDPVCGSMNASVGQWLTTTGAAPSAYRVSQGARVGRAGTIGIAADADGTVWVGGAATSCIRGTITL